MSFNNRTGIASLIRILLFSCRQNFPFFLPVYKIPCTYQMPGSMICRKCRFSFIIQIKNIKYPLIIKWDGITKPRIFRPVKQIFHFLLLYSGIIYSEK